MDQKELFKKYYSRLVKEAVIKSVVCGLIVGFACNFVAALATWFSPVSGLWLSLAVGVFAFAVSAAAFYFLRFKPTERDVARRLDQLGLEERLVTMLDYRNEPAGIYEIQRADAREKLGGVEAKRLKLRLSVPAVASACVVAVLGIFMTVVTGMSDKGLVAGGQEFIEENFKEDVYCSVTYEVALTYDRQTFFEDEGGIIDGEFVQIVLQGDDAATVTAVPDEGYMFWYWMDKENEEIQDPIRTDLKIKEDAVYTAVFAPLSEDSSEGDEDSDSESGDENGPSDVPRDESESDSESSSSSNPDPNQQPGSNSGSGSHYDDYNQIIDDETYYRDVYQAYYDEAMRKLAEGEEVSDEVREFIEKYLGIIL